MARLKPLGFEIWECWAQALLIDPSTPAGRAVRAAYEDVIDGVRIMTKFVEYDHHRKRFDKTVAMVKRAKEYGLKVQLCIDWHNIATDRNDYHRSRYFTRNTINAVAELLDIFQPDQLEVCNEPYTQKKKSDRYTPKEYAERVYWYVRGAKMAGWAGLIIATQSPPPGQKEFWEWHVGPNGDWPRWGHLGLAESKHEPPGVLHRITDPKEYAEALRPMPDPNDPDAEPYYWQRPGAKGWNYPVFVNELSSVGRDVHINTNLGADMVYETLRFFRSIKSPFCFLQMGGTEKDFGPPPSPSGWGMNTQLVNSEGEFSKGLKEMYKFKGVDLPDLDRPADPDPDRKPSRVEPGTKFRVRNIARTMRLLEENHGIVDRAAREAKTDREFQVTLKGEHDKQAGR